MEYYIQKEEFKEASNAFSWEYIFSATTHLITGKSHRLSILETRLDSAVVINHTFKNVYHQQVLNLQLISRVHYN